MKLLLTLLLLSLVSASLSIAHAQLQTTSNTVITNVGDPVVSLAICPIPNGTITCGSKNVPIGGCGHCGIGYGAFMSNCTYEGINYAMDIGGSDFESIILPSVENQAIEWSFVDETNRKVDQAIQRYAGTNPTTGEKYWIQFHHTKPGSGNPGVHISGEIGANICGDGCNMGHVHVEFAKVDASGNNIWQDAPNYFCR